METACRPCSWRPGHRRGRRLNGGQGRRFHGDRVLTPLLIYTYMEESMGTQLCAREAFVGVGKFHFDSAFDMLWNANSILCLLLYS